MRTPRRRAFDHSVVASPRCARAIAPATISENSRVSSNVYRRSTGTRTCIPSALDVFGNDSSPSASSACLRISVTSSVSAKPTSGDGSRSKRTKSGRSGLSKREYHVFMSMQPMFTIQSRASSSFTIGASIHFFRRGCSRVDTWTWNLGIHSGMWLGASFRKNAFPYAPSG